jgi:hypothetical protein
MFTISPTDTDNLEGMEGRSRVPCTRKNGYPSPRRMDQGAPPNTRMVQVALRALVLQPGGLWFGSRDWSVVSTILPQAPVQSGAGVESYSDASSGMAQITPNEVYK